MKTGGDQTTITESRILSSSDRVLMYQNSTHEVPRSSRQAGLILKDEIHLFVIYKVNIHTHCIKLGSGCEEKPLTLYLRVVLLHWVAGPNLTGV